VQVWIGTSGYSYPDWVGSFYPPGTRPRQLLAYYCRQFPLVELNYTFYRPATPGQLARLAQRTPAGFQFLVKLHRSLSHEQSAEALVGFRQAVEELRGRGRLLGLLCQLPQTVHHGREAKGWLERLARELGGCGLAVEFRHRSWHRPDLTAWLQDHGLDLVAVDVPDLPQLFPRGLAPSGPRVYIRFHSRNADNWYHSDKDRYDYDYRDDELAEWVGALRQAAPRTEQAMLLFNNCHRGHAGANARRMRELLARLPPPVRVVEPFPAPEPGSQQRSLFD
jgi:uncharacterized protein YecE (DUF72 family)